MKLDKLSDQEYLLQHIESLKFVLQNDSNTIIFVKDSDFVFRFVSEGFEPIVGKNNFKNIIGKTDYQITSLNQDPNCCNDIRDHDVAVRDTNKPQKFLYISPDQNIYVTNKRPIINPHTGNFVGIHGYMHTFLLPSALKFIYKINQVESPIISDNDDFTPYYDLTERQHMVLFLYLNRYSYSEIAEILTKLGYKISAGRVNHHLENLKYIFNVKSKEALLERALSMNYHLFIPRKFLTIGSYGISEELVVSTSE